ncbi:MAG: ABC transporter ATP-binding protein [Thalassobaculum sp.]|uniref:ABC transporter ATP-binding protein n=1 Tax=Thalassobaculum sp. TaxID=2022740 RepID=UPI0032EB7782
MSSEAQPTPGEPAIVIEDVTKIFSIFKRPTDRLLQMLSMGRRRYYETFVALNRVTVTIHRGETVGIVGPNGSGKSTLLQIIAGLLQPSGGRVSVTGRAAALLELGAGFNPEFTGRENIYLNASILGLSQAEIDARYDDIVAFSGLGDFIDRPVVTYSSGMYVRLAFSIAASVDPDILIVDEALAVGDEGFQRKCLARIEALRDKGTTILFVSHAMGMITQLCDRAVLMDRGEVLLIGEPKLVASNYYRLTHAPATDRERIRTEIRSAVAEEEAEIHAGLDETLQNQSRVEYESQGARILDPRIETMNGMRVNQLSRGRMYKVCYDVAFDSDCEQVRYATLFKTMTGVELSGRASHRLHDTMPNPRTGERAVLTFEFPCSFLPGTYFINVGVNGLVAGERQSLHRIMDAVMFQVLPDTDDSLVGILDIGIIPSVDHDLVAGIAPSDDD